jgi:orotate phosphoribosyltransferase
MSTRIAEFLLSVGAVKLSPRDPFTWTSGIKSPIYCDNRMLYGHPEARNIVVQELASRVKSLHVPADAIAGTATAAIGWGALVADRLGLPFCYVRAKAKEHGAKKRIEGDLKKESHVVLVEDLLSTGGSAISSVEALRTEANATVSDVVAIFTYEFIAAREAAMEGKVQLHPLTTISVLLEAAQNQNRITAEEAQMVLQFVRDPQKWGG